MLVGAFGLPVRAVDAILCEMRILESNPYTCRKAGSNPLERELVNPFGGSGPVALFEIISGREVAVSALHQQSENDDRWAWPPKSQPATVTSGLAAERRVWSLDTDTHVEASPGGVSAERTVIVRARPQPVAQASRKPPGQ